MINEDLVNYGMFIMLGIQSVMKPGHLYRTGKMRSSVRMLIVDDSTIDIIISAPYASYTNSRGIRAGWLENTVDRLSRCYTEDTQSKGINGYQTTISEEEI